MCIQKSHLRAYVKEGKEAASGGKLDAVLRSLGQLKSLAGVETVPMLVNHIIQRFDIAKFLEKPQKQKKLKQLYSTIIRFDHASDGLRQCAEYFQYLQEHEFYDPQADKVTLLTMHAAKGLEFAYVFICGFEDGIIPLARKGHEVENEDEERRLCYVALTRAKTSAWLFETKERNRKKTMPSRFKKYIARSPLVEREDEAAETIAKKQELKKLKKSRLS